MLGKHLNFGYIVREDGFFTRILQKKLQVAGFILKFFRKKRNLKRFCLYKTHINQRMFTQEVLENKDFPGIIVTRQKKCLRMYTIGGVHRFKKCS